MIVEVTNGKAKCEQSAAPIKSYLGFPCSYNIDGVNAINNITCFLSYPWYYPHIRSGY